MSARLRYAIPAIVLLAACSGSSDDDSGAFDGPPPEDGPVTGTTDGADDSDAGTDGTDGSGADGSDTGTDGTGTDGSDTGAGTPGTGSPAIGVETYESVLEGLVGVIGNGRFEVVHDRFLAFVDPLRDDRQATTVDGLTFVREEEVAVEGGGSATRREYTCGGGGTFAETGLPAGSAYELDGCDVDGVVRDGNVTAVFARGQDTYEYASFTEAGSGEGDVVLAGRRFDSHHPRTLEGRFAWTVDDFRHEGADGVTTLSDASFENRLALAEVPPSSRPIPPDEYARTLSATFTVSAPWSGGEAITASTDETPFADFGPPGVYASGALTANAASDGSSLVLDAGTGEPANASVTVTEAGATSGFTVPWSEIGMLPCLAPSGESAETYGCRPEL